MIISMSHETADIKANTNKMEDLNICPIIIH